ncbi:glycosyltransferase [Allostella humosa]|nr:glycosyltransferase [Stella humosa]
MASAATHLPDHERWVVLATERIGQSEQASLPPATRLVTPGDAAVPDLDVRRRLYNVTEFCTAIKPDIIQWLWRQGYDEVVYFDPDIVLFDRPDEIGRAWAAGAEVALTPHLATATDHPGWVMRAVNLSGQFNLGFIAVRNRPEARRLVEWWRAQIAWNCIEDAGNGTFVDQKVVDHFPALSAAVHVIRHPGYNVAYWNLHEREMTRTGGRYATAGLPLAFFHFSGFEMFGAGVSRHTALARAGDGAVETILRDYGRRLVAGNDLALSLAPYDYDRFPDGTRSSALLRQALHRAIRAEAIAAGDILRPGFLLAPVPAVAPARYGGAVPRILALIAGFADLPEELRQPFDGYLAADHARRHKAVIPLLMALHRLGAVDAGTAEAIAGARHSPAPPAEADGGRITRLTWPADLGIEGWRQIVRLPALPFLLHSARPDLMESFDLDTAEGLIGYLAWFLAIGQESWKARAETIGDVVTALDQVPLPAPADLGVTEGSLLDAAILHVFAPATRHEGPPAPAGVLALEALLSGARNGPIKPAVAHVLRTWLWHREGGATPKILRLLAASARLRGRLLGSHTTRRITVEAVDEALSAIGLADLGRHPPPPPLARRRLPVPDDVASDCAIVGPFASVSGVGHAARGLRTLLRAAGRRPASIDLLAPADRPDAAGGDGWPTDRPLPLLVLHANADVTLDAIAKFEPLWRRAARRVGYWYWELPAMTGRMAAPAMLLDEIWVATEFVRRSVAPQVAIPVRVRPPVLQPADFTPSSPGGGSFGASRRGYRFLTVLDARSFLARKNPAGVVGAFLQAFPEGDEPAELLVKLSNGHGADQGLANLRDMAAADRRVRVLDGHFTDIEMNDLYESADCFVSLHRSEGLGLGIAQAMMRGKAVIATGYGGPMDFLSTRTAFLVPFRMVPVERDAYPDWLGQEWAEPDERAAAVYMKELVRNPAAGRALGDRARPAAERFFSPARILGQIPGPAAPPPLSRGAA